MWLSLERDPNSTTRLDGLCLFTSFNQISTLRTWDLLKPDMGDGTELPLTSQWVQMSWTNIPPSFLPSLFPFSVFFPPSSNFQAVWDSNTKKIHTLFFSSGLAEIPIYPGPCGELGAECREEEQDHSLSQSVEQIIKRFLCGSARVRGIPACLFKVFPCTPGTAMFSPDFWQLRGCGRVRLAGTPFLGLRTKPCECDEKVGSDSETKCVASTGKLIVLVNCSN